MKTKQAAEGKEHMHCSQDGQEIASTRHKDLTMGSLVREQKDDICSGAQPMNEWM